MAPYHSVQGHAGMTPFCRSVSKLDNWEPLVRQELGVIRLCLQTPLLECPSLPCPFLPFALSSPAPVSSLRTLSSQSRRGACGCSSACLPLPIPPLALSSPPCLPLSIPLPCLVSPCPSPQDIEFTVQEGRLWMLPGAGQASARAQVQ